MKLWGPPPCAANKSGRGPQMLAAGLQGDQRCFNPYFFPQKKKGACGGFILIFGKTNTIM